MNDDLKDVTPPEPPEPEASEPEKSDRSGVWMRGLWMLVLVFLFALAETVLFACAVLQFLWMLFSGKKNSNIAKFGDSLGRWLAATARFQSGATEEKPFPWSSWA